MRRGSFAIWRSVAGFHLRLTLRRPAPLPLLCVPVLGDALHSVLIRQELQGATDGRAAVLEASRATPELLVMKLRFELAALAWSLVPIYGLIPAMRHRLYWGMASNVLVFEGLSGEPGRERCRALAEGYDLRFVLRTLLVAPTVLIALLESVLVTAVSLIGLEGPAVIALFVAFFLYVAGPGSAAANTFVYLQIAPVMSDAAGLATGTVDDAPAVAW